MLFKLLNCEHVVLHVDHMSQGFPSFQDFRFLSNFIRLSTHTMNFEITYSKHWYLCSAIHVTQTNQVSILQSVHNIEPGTQPVNKIQNYTWIKIKILSPVHITKVMYCFVDFFSLVDTVIHQRKHWNFFRALSLQYPSI